MKTTLNENGQIGIPEQYRDADHLVPGDSFELERIRAGHYLLARRKKANNFSVEMHDDGLPIIRVDNGVITSRLVKKIESQSR